MFKLSIHGKTHEELAAGIAKLHAAFNGKDAPAKGPFRANDETAAAKATTTTTTTTTTTDKPATAPKPSAVAKPAVAAVAPAPKAAPKSAAKPKAEDAYEPVRQAILAATAAGHRKSVKDLLAEYDAASGQDLDPSVYQDVLDKLAVVTAGEVDLA